MMCMVRINRCMCEHALSQGHQGVTHGYEMEDKLNKLLASFKEFKEARDANCKELTKRLEKLEKKHAHRPGHGSQACCKENKRKLWPRI